MHYAVTLGSLQFNEVRHMDSLTLTARALRNVRHELTVAATVNLEKLNKWGKYRLKLMNARGREQGRKTLNGVGVVGRRAENIFSYCRELVSSRC